MGPRHHKVIGPDMVWPARPKAHARAVVEPQPAPLGLFLGHLQPFLFPDAFHPLMVHHPAIIPEQRQDAAIAVATVLADIVNDGRSQPHLVIGLGGLITLGRPWLPNHPADPTFRHRQRPPNMLEASPATGRA